MRRLTRTTFDQPQPPREWERGFAVIAGGNFGAAGNRPDPARLAVPVATFDFVQPVAGPAIGWPDAGGPVVAAMAFPQRPDPGVPFGQGTHRPWIGAWLTGSLPAFAMGRPGLVAVIVVVVSGVAGASLFAPTAADRGAPTDRGTTLAEVAALSPTLPLVASPQPPEVLSAFGRHPSPEMPRTPEPETAVAPQPVITAPGAAAETVPVETLAELPEAGLVAEARTAALAETRSHAAVRAAAASPPLPQRSPLVGNVQRALHSHGIDPGPVDGALGPRTVAAVKIFQERVGARPDGVVDTALLRRIETSDPVRFRRAEASRSGGGPVPADPPAGPLAGLVRALGELFGTAGVAIRPSGSSGSPAGPDFTGHRGGADGL